MSTLVIAEIGSVHDGSFGNALKLIDAAKESGADAVKLQTHIAEAETLRDAPMPSFFSAEPRYEYFQRTGFSLEQWQKIRAHCDSVGVLFLSSPFSEEAVDLLEQLGMEMYKVPSGEVTNTPMLDKIGRLRKPVLLSSGMSSWAELDHAVAVIQRYHARITVLQCTTEYPCPYEHAGLNVIAELRQRYGLPVGFSDHTATIVAPLAAVALGATVVEKHFTFSRKMYGSDAKHSLEPHEFAEMVSGIRAIEVMQNNPVDKDDLTHLNSMKQTFEKSIVAIVDIPAGSVINSKMIAIRKPGTGISASRFLEVLGRRAAAPVPAGRVMMPSDVVWESKE